MSITPVQRFISQNHLQSPKDSQLLKTLDRIPKTSPNKSNLLSDFGKLNRSKILIPTTLKGFVKVLTSTPRSEGRSDVSPRFVLFYLRYLRPSTSCIPTPLDRPQYSELLPLNTSPPTLSFPDLRQYIHVFYKKSWRMLLVPRHPQCSCVRCGSSVQTSQGL